LKVVSGDFRFITPNPARPIDREVCDLTVCMHASIGPATRLPVHANADDFFERFFERRLDARIVTLGVGLNLPAAVVRPEVRDEGGVTFHHFISDLKLERETGFNSIDGEVDEPAADRF
jgi:hypothetical protein